MVCTYDCMEHMPSTLTNTWHSCAGRTHGQDCEQVSVPHAFLAGSTRLYFCNLFLPQTPKCLCTHRNTLR